MNTKNILTGIAAIVGTFVLLFVVYKFTNTPARTEFPEVNVKRAEDHVKWKRDSKNILVEYSDLQCPACKDFNNALKDIEKTATPNATFIFRHYPLYQIHPNAFSAAYAAEAAANQGKFWEMETILFDKQNEWNGLQNPSGYFIKTARDLKLDPDKFKKDMDSEAVKQRVQANISEAEKAGFNSTPTFVLNGKKVNVATFEEFKQLLLSL